MESFFKYVILFFFYSAAGWLIESLYRSIGEKRIINSGFLTGPMCPIYGTGATVLTLFIYIPFKEKPLLVFLVGMLVCDIVEYLTSVLMEKLFNARWWDYTYEFLNINGRICLKHTLYWGIASIAFVNLIHPGIDAMISKINPEWYLYISIAIFAVFLLDVINSVRKALDIRKLQVKLNKIIDTISGGLSSVKSTIEDKYNDIHLTLENTSDKLTDARSDIYEQIQDLVSQFELRFTKSKTKNKEKNSFSNRYLQNDFAIEKHTRKQLDKLKKIAEEIKSNIFENGEMQ